MLPVSGMKKIEILKKYIDDDIHGPRVDKKVLLYTWILIYRSEEKTIKKQASG